ncbi:alpha/beta hydrolase [Halobacillus amylolyticus]|uniref:Alpha/beta hydrolase n=1 Tax=Halobacillus amylolyticus TaxID=2932259 RepID=A0ABY4HC91_9BACI|nr:alpha/beta hydrolase [Halobacillus amylolyticus]UOR11030.1 alpha/beta hydrolase [Halobacillus amylolyticus]
MKRVTFSNSRDLTLVGDLHSNKGTSVIIMCHGFLSNRSSRGRFGLFASAFHQLGLSVLRFDFGGCGESEDSPLTLANEVDDLTPAMHYAIESGYEDIILYGHSLGARVCLEAFNHRYVRTMILTGAGTGPVNYHWPDIFNQEQLKELARTGTFTVEVNGPYRNNMLITEEMLKDFERCDQEQLLSNVTCPTLLIHGDQGEEGTLMPITKQGMKWLPESSKLKVINGAEHSFIDHLDVVQQTASDWLLTFANGG